MATVPKTVEARGFPALGASARGRCQRNPEWNCSALERGQEQERRTTIPRTAAEMASAAWRREFAGLRPDDFAIIGSILDELPRIAGAEQVELGLAALATGLTHRL